MSWFTGAVDPRVKIAAPIMGISTYAADLKDNTQKLHCDCMFPINSWLHDMIHQGALIAPRPLLYGEGKRDKLFPVEGYMEFYDKVGGLYKAYRQDEAFRLLEVDTGHQDSDFLRTEVSCRPEIIASPSRRRASSSSAATFRSMSIRRRASMSRLR